MPTLDPIATVDDLVEYGYDPSAESMLVRASTRVRAYARQEITRGTSTLTLPHGGEWVLPQRPLVSVDFVTDDEGEAVEYGLRGARIFIDECDSPVTVEYTHGFDPVPDGLVELVCSVASRLSSTPAAVHSGAQTEQAGGLSVTWGGDSYGGTTSLTRAEKRVIDSFFPALPFTVRLL